MMNEELLKAAAAEISLCQLSSLEAIEEQDHTFSPKFEKKMRRLIAKTDHPYRRILLNAVAIFMAVMMLFAALMAINPNVRAAVIKWVCNISGGVVHYHYGGERSASKVPDYVLSQLPEGYTLHAVRENKDGTEYVYYGPNGMIMKFLYTSGADASDLYLYNSNCKHSEVLIRETTADLYINPFQYQTSEIIWADPEGNVLFMISYHGEQENLVEMARSVKMK